MPSGGLEKRKRKRGAHLIGKKRKKTYQGKLLNSKPYAK
jgi:hypothetical protein